MKLIKTITRFLALFLLLAFSVSIILIDVNIFHEKKSSQPSMSGAMKALTFWTRSRAYPEKDIPANKYYKEYQKAKLALRKDSGSSGYNTTWKTMGPYNILGRMISLAVNPKNPQTLYAGSASGGLWRTYKASSGANWHRIHTGFPVLGVMAIVIDPVDTNKIYIGTGEVYGYDQSFGGEVIRTTRGSYGIGILKTSDGGATWEKTWIGLITRKKVFSASG